MLYVGSCLADITLTRSIQRRYFDNLFYICFQSVALSLAHRSKMDDSFSTIQGDEWVRNCAELVHVPVESRKYCSLHEPYSSRSNIDSFEYSLSDIFQLSLLFHRPWLEYYYLGYVQV